MSEPLDSEAQAELVDLFEHAPCGYVSVDAEGRIARVNQTFCGWIGYESAEMLGRRLPEFLNIAGRIFHETHFAPLLRMQGSFNEVALDFTTKGGERLPVLVNGAERRDAAGQATAVRLTLFKATDRRRYERDLLAARKAAETANAQLQAANLTLETRIAQAVAERMVTEEALRQSQKLEAIGQLTGGVAHDFNNLLTIIQSSVEFLQRADLPDERRQRYVEAIAQTVQRAAHLTGQLLAFARRQPLNPVAFDVGRQVSAVVDLIRPLVGGRVTITVEQPEAPCFAFADASHFETALINLAVNARDAMVGEGELAIRIGRSLIPPIRNHPQRDGDFISVAVTDTGTGIDPDKLETIFEPFYTTKEAGKGTGLGLSQVFGFAKQTKGEVDVVSALGLGTTFTLFLPAAVEIVEPAASAPVKPAARVQGEGACVLVVEDNPVVGEFATEMLHDLGFRTTWATNAAEALALLAKDASAYELLFTDVVMQGMNGLDLARTVRDRNPTLPVVLTSGYGGALADEGLHGFTLVQKPYSVDALSAVLHAAMAARRR